MPVDNNEHQRIDDISTDRISYGIVTRDNGFRLVTHELFDCFAKARLHTGAMFVCIYPPTDYISV